MPQLAREKRGREPIGLSEDHVVGDDAGAKVLQASGELGKSVARPRPLSERCERAFVDVDNPNRKVVVRARPHALVRVESPLADHGQKPGVGKPKGCECRADGKGNSKNEECFADGARHCR